MGDTLGLIYPHGNFVQPNLPPPDFNKEILFNTLEELETWENENQAKAVANDLYIYTSYKSEEKQGSVGVEKNTDKLIPGLGSGNKGLAIIQIQGLADLNEKSEWVHRNTKYYDKWNKKYYDAIVKRRYKDSNYDSEEFENNG